MSESKTRKGGKSTLATPPSAEETLLEVGSNLPTVIPPSEVGFSSERVSIVEVANLPSLAGETVVVNPLPLPDATPVVATTVTVASTLPVVGKGKKGGWNPSLPLASVTFPSVGISKGIGRDANGNQQDTQGYACYATMRKHAGEWKTWMEWESLTQSTFSVTHLIHFKKGFEGYCWWVSSPEFGKGKTSKVSVKVEGGKTLYAYIP